MFQKEFPQIFHETNWYDIIFQVDLTKYFSSGRKKKLHFEYIKHSVLWKNKNISWNQFTLWLKMLISRNFVDKTYSAQQMKLQCFKSNRAQIYIKHIKPFHISKPKFQNMSIVCRVLHNFCLKFGSANLEQPFSKTDRKFAQLHSSEKITVFQD